METLLERLTGRFTGMRRYEDIDEAIRIIREYLSSTHRLVIYDENLDYIIIAYTIPEKGAIAVVGLDYQNNLRFIDEFPRLSRGYIEIYSLTRESLQHDMETIKHYASVKGLGGKVLNEVEVPERRPMRETRGFREVYTEAMQEHELSETLANILKTPSGIGSIILHSTEYFFKSLTFKQAIDLLMSYIRSKEPRNLAIKIEVGGYTLWIIRIGKHVGVVGFDSKGHPFTLKSTSADKLDEAEKIARNIVNSAGGKVDVHIYVLPPELRFSRGKLYK